MRAEPFGRSLVALQAALYDLITAPEGVARRLGELDGSPADLEALVKPSPAMTAVERLDVYANMYFYRILDVLRVEYARVVAAVGDAEFHNLITAYLTACPPAHPSLREAGARLFVFLARHPLAEERPWLVELARLERTHLELYDGPDAAALTMDEIRGSTPEAWPGLYLRAVSCHAVLRNRFTLSRAWRTLGSGDPAGAVPAVRETLLVWRQGFQVFHRVVEADEEPLLALLETGARFDTVCERLLGQVPEEEAALRAFQLLGRWVTEGLVAAPR